MNCIAYPTRPLLLVAHCLCCGAAAAAGQTGPTAESSASATGPIAVVAFVADQSVDPRDQWLPTAIEEALYARLRRLPGCAVMPTVRAYQARRELESDSEPEPKWERVLPLLGARVHIHGTVGGHPDALTLELVFQPLGSAAAPQQTVQLGPGKMFGVLDDATRWLLQRLELKRIASETEKLIFAPPGATGSALEYYARAIRAARDRNPRDAIYYLTKTINYDGAHLSAQLMMAEMEARLTPSARATASARLRHVLDLARRNHDRRLEIEIELAHGTVLLLSDSFGPALERLRRALELAGTEQDIYGRIAALNAIADAHLRREARPDRDLENEQRERFQTEQLEQAAQALEGVLQSLGELHDRVAEPPIANKLALVYERLDQPQRALAAHKRTLAAAQSIGSAQSQATAWMFLGQWYRGQEQLDDARDAMLECLKLASAASQPKVRIALADIYDARGAREEALKQYLLAYEAIKDGDELGNQLICLQHIAQIHKDLEHTDQAVRALQDALDIAQILESPIEKSLREKLAEWKSE